MDQMNVSITDELATYVRKKVKSGRYNNASEVVRDALRRMEEDDAKNLRLAEPSADALLADLTQQQLDLVHRRVREGIRALDAGRFNSYEGSSGLRELAARVKARGRQRLPRKTTRANASGQ
jgi:antitoxin ParD1/3/4